MLDTVYAAVYAVYVASRKGRHYIIIEITREQHRTLKRAAKKSKRTISAMVRSALGLSKPGYKQARRKS